MTTLVATRTDNPYWDAVKGDVTRDPWEHGLNIGSLGNWNPTLGRFDHTGQYAWTVTDPPTVDFVAEHLGPDAFDPLAGSGYWAYLLGQRGISVLASDLTPPAEGSGNIYHKGTGTWVPVRRADAVDACREWGLGRALLLSWPPYDEPTGAAVLTAYLGDRVVYIGEGEGGCCGTDGMFDLFDREWVEVASHRPVQWYGLHDWVTVYERRQLPALVGGAS